MTFKFIHAAVPILTLALANSCDRTLPDNTPEDVTVRFSCGWPTTRTADPDENKISDLNIFILNGEGQLEESHYLERSQLEFDDGDIYYGFKWLTGTDCQVIACANFGFRMTGIRTRDDLMDYRYYMPYPDEYSRGIPMSGRSGIVTIGKANKAIEIPLIRMMSKISLSVDRTALDKNVKFNIRSVQIGGCPKSATLFGQSKATGNTDIFTSGYIKRYSEVDDMNIDKSAGISEKASVYMLENMQGILLPDAKTEKDKVLDVSDAISEVCSYVEIKAEYRSDTYYSKPEEYLIYRFYLGDSPSNFDVERNCHYHITVKPSGTGLEETSWRVDKSGLAAYNPSTLVLHPGNYIETTVGATLHIWAETVPDKAEIVFSTADLDEDRNDGLYDYTLDEDGSGVTLYPKKRGTGVFELDAGAPCNDGALIVVVIN